MNKEQIQLLAKLTAAQELIKKMGSIIRYLDEDSAYCEYWLNDGSDKESAYVHAAIDAGIDI